LKACEKKLTRDLGKALDDLIFTQDELASTRGNLALCKIETRIVRPTMLREKILTVMFRARRENDSVKVKLRQSEQEAQKLQDTIDRIRRNELEHNKLKSKYTKLEEKMKQLQDDLNRSKSSNDKVSAQLDIAQNSENVKGTQITNLTEKVKALQAQVTKQEKSVLEYQTQESDFQADINYLEERLNEAESKVSETKEQQEVLQLQYNELGQQLTSTQQELAANKLLLTEIRSALWWKNSIDGRKR